jgi:hypothetical protein
MPRKSPFFLGIKKSSKAASNVNFSIYPFLSILSIYFCSTSNSFPDFGYNGLNSRVFPRSRGIL